MTRRRQVLIFFTFSMLLFCSLNGIVFALSDSWVEWRKTYDGSDAFSLVQTPDGGFAFCGRTFINDEGDFLLVKTDSLGKVEWNKTYGGAEYEQAQAMIITSDGGYALTGPTSSFGGGLRDIWLVKTDALGDVEWNQTYGGAEAEVSYSLVQTSDGGYAMVGVRHRIDADGSDCLLVKTDSLGNLQWSKILVGGGVDRAFSVIETSDEGLVILCKEYTMGDYLAYATIIKTDESGNVEWQQSFEGTFGNDGFPMIKTSDDNFAFACPNYLFDLEGRGGDFWLIKMDNDGNVKLNKTYGGSKEDIPYSLIETSDGGFALAGSTESFGYGNTDFWLLKLDDLGEIEWNRFYGTSEHEIATSLLETSDNGYLLLGDHLIWGSDEQDIWLIKTNIQGIPEFPSWMLLSIFLVISIVAIVSKNYFKKITLL